MATAAPFNPETLSLRDIHLPPPISWWPPAPGWWLSLIIMLLLAVIGCWFWRRWQRRRYRRLLLNRLQQLEEQFRQQTDLQQLLKALSQLLRQAALLHFPPAECAGLVGESWLRFLDRALPGELFSTGVGRVLADGPYLPQPEVLDTAALLTLCRRWLRRLPPAPISPGRHR